MRRVRQRLAYRHVVAVDGATDKGGMAYGNTTDNISILSTMLLGITAKQAQPDNTVLSGSRTHLQ